LSRQGKLAEAEARHRRAIELNPSYAMAYNNLGHVHGRQGNLVEAERLFRKAIALDPANTLAHGNLFTALLDQGKWSEAVDTYEKAVRHSHRLPIARSRITLLRRVAALEPQLSAYLAGGLRAANGRDSLALAWLCQFRRLHQAAARFSNDAFEADPTCADDFQASFRYDAACSAALAAGGKAKDAVNVDDKEKARLRSLALSWLRADLAAWRKLAESAKPVDRAQAHARMHHWLQDPDLASVRGKEAVDKIPAAERQGWGALWEDVSALLRKTSGK
jgi:tetratricopeptide (TPR) repeat protein